MSQQLLAMFVQHFVAGLIGGYGGYRYAIRTVQPAERPNGMRQFALSVAAGVGASLVSILFILTMLYAFPNADIKQVEGILPLAFGVGLGAVITQRRYRST